MPKKPLVSSDELLACLVTQGPLCDATTGNLYGPSHEAWNAVERELHGRCKANYIYQRVKENRDGLWDSLCQTSQVVRQPQPSADRVPDKPESASSPSSTEEHSETTELATFLIKLPPGIWNKVKPVKTSYRRLERGAMRDVMVLPQQLWEFHVLDLLWHQHKIPCCYQFKKSRVTPSQDVYVHIEASCKECGANGFGTLAFPHDATPVLEWSAIDTRGTPHHIKRQLTGERRVEVAKKIANTCASVYRRLEARSIMEEGDVEPPHLYTASVLRKAKQELKDKDTSIIGPDPIVCLELLKHQEPYAGTIRDIGLDKFFIHYYSPSQVMVYKTYCKQGYVAMAIDATGSLVKKLQRLHGPSGHIFLYEGVVNINRMQLPVLQMLSEKQDANSILYWLNEWERNGGVCPQEVVIDNSAALKSAVSRSFGRSADVVDYKNKCFNRLLGTSSSLPPCFIRLDVGHMVHSVVRWKDWNSPQLNRLKDFYVRVFGLLIKSMSLSGFQKILEALFLLLLSGQMCEATEEALECLKSGIKADHNGDVIESLSERQKMKNKHYFDEHCAEEGQNSNLKQWLKGIKTRAQELASFSGENLSPYYAPNIADKFERVVGDFVMWSGVMVPLFKSPNDRGTSATVESDFNDLKSRILKGETTPLLVHKFIIQHINIIDGTCKIAIASTIGTEKENERKDEEPGKEERNWPEEGNGDSDDSSIVSEAKEEKLPRGEFLEKTEKPGYTPDEALEKAPLDLLFYENWRNKIGKKAPPRKKPKYLTPFPELDAALHGHKLKQPSNPLLRNGNFCPLITTDSGRKVQIQNSCSFDALVSILSNAYIESVEYRSHVDLSDSACMNTVKSLATLGGVKETYELRAEALMEVLDPRAKPPSLRTITKDKRIVQYDCTDNITNLAKKLLEKTPSLQITSSCKPNCERRKQEDIIVVPTAPHIVVQEGLSCGLIHAMRKGMGLPGDKHSGEIPAQVQLEHCSHPCKATPLLRISTPSGHLVVETDYLGQSLPFAPSPYNSPLPLSKLPVSVSVAGRQFTIRGIVAYRPGHYIAYTRRFASGSWDLHDGLLTKISKNINETEEVIPHLLVYTEE